jgi:MoxR-like ATPase
MSVVDTKSDLTAVENLNAAYEKIKAEIGKVIIGQEQVIEQLLISLCCRRGTAFWSASRGWPRRC